MSLAENYPEPDSSEIPEDLREALYGPEFDTEHDTRATWSSESSTALDLYLRRIGEIPLLTAAQEVELSKLKDIYMPYQLTQEEGEGLSEDEQTQAFLDKIKHLPQDKQDQIIKGQQAFNHMIEANLRLVVSNAKKYRGNGVPFLDLIQEGNLGLKRAVEKFDWQRGFKFSTYATWWIRQSVQRSVSNLARTIRLPVHIVERGQQIKRAQSQLLIDLGRKPTDEEIAESTGLPVNHVTEALAAYDINQRFKSLNSLVGDEEDAELGDLLSTEAGVEYTHEDDVADRAHAQMLAGYLRNALDSLSEKEQVVVRLRYGIDTDTEAMTLAEVGRRLGITRERVRQIEDSALKKLERNKHLIALKTESDTEPEIKPNTVWKQYLLPNAGGIRKQFSDQEITIMRKFEEGKTVIEIAKEMGLESVVVKRTSDTVRYRLKAEGRAATIKLMAGMVLAEPEQKND